MKVSELIDTLKSLPDSTLEKDVSIVTGPTDDEVFYLFDIDFNEYTQCLEITTEYN